MTTRILYVCLGNICRSLAAEGLCRATTPALTLDSAGLADWHLGKPPYQPMQDAARARGLDLSALRARRFVRQDFHRRPLLLHLHRRRHTHHMTKRPKPFSVLLE